MRGGKFCLYPLMCKMPKKYMTQTVLPPNDSINKQTFRRDLYSCQAP